MDREQPDPPEAAGLDVRPQSAPQNPRRSRRLLPRWVPEDAEDLPLGGLTASFLCHVSGRKGGELASAVHAYGKTGDPQMRALVQHILCLVSHPILNFLYRWIYDGELEDTYHEVRPQSRRDFSATWTKKGVTQRGREDRAASQMRTDDQRVMETTVMDASLLAFPASPLS